MTYALNGVSQRRNSAWLTQSQREQFKPCASEIAIHQLAARMGVRLPAASKEVA